MPDKGMKTIASFGSLVRRVKVPVEPPSPLGEKATSTSIDPAMPTLPSARLPSESKKVPPMSFETVMEYVSSAVPRFWSWNGSLDVWPTVTVPKSMLAVL